MTLGGKSASWWLHPHWSLCSELLHPSFWQAWSLVTARISSATWWGFQALLSSPWGSCFVRSPGFHLPLPRGLQPRCSGRTVWRALDLWPGSVFNFSLVKICHRLEGGLSRAGTWHAFLGGKDTNLSIYKSSVVTSSYWNFGSQHCFLMLKMSTKTYHPLLQLKKVKHWETSVLMEEWSVA